MIKSLKEPQSTSKMYEYHADKFVIIKANTFENFRKNLKQAREKEKGKLVGFTSKDDSLNRKILEKEKVDIFMPYLSHRKDFQKQRNSGFDSVMAKMAKRGNVIIGINFDEIVNSKGKRKAEVLARISQNIRLCNKNRLKMKFIYKKENERDIYDLRALGLVLGMPTWIIKDL